MNRLPQVGLVGLVIASQAFAQDDAAQRVPVLATKSFAAWRDRIRIDDAELAWAQLPWLTTYHEGLEKASEQARPLLLWVMNGHPLGCT
jgi:hypothetical protein